MESTLAITYTKCAFCTAKNHCKACGAELAESLAQKPGVRSAAFSIREHTASVVHNLDPLDLEDLLEGMGVMVDE